MSEHSILQKELFLRLKSTGLTIGQPKVLDYLAEHNGSSQKEIARGCHIEPATLTSLLNRMEEKGLVSRRTLHGNRRTFYIFLTEKGSELASLVQETFAELEEDAFRGISKSDRQMFMELFFRIYENMTSKEDSV